VLRGRELRVVNGAHNAVLINNISDATRNQAESSWDAKELLKLSTLVRNDWEG